MVRPCFLLSPKFSSEEMREGKGERKGKKAAAREEITQLEQLSFPLIPFLRAWAPFFPRAVS